MRPHKPYTPRQRGPQVTCECGQQVYDDTTGKQSALHQRSVFHRQHRRVVSLLATNCLTLEEIGQRLGITRERVRQIAVRLNIVCEDRRQVCTVTRADRRWRAAIKDRATGRLIEVLDTEGIPWDRILAQTSSGLYWLTKALRVNGLRVQVRGAWLNKNGYVAARGEHTEGSDVAVYALPDGNWLVVPSARRLPKYTLFALEPDLDGRGATQGKRHDYMSMVNDWSVFKGALK